MEADLRRQFCESKLAILLWYAPDRAVTLDLEGSCEDTCQLLGIG
jgi:hypothetical protein